MNSRNQVIAVAVVIAIGVAVFGIVALGQMMLLDNGSDGYTVTISIDAMEVATDDGYVYNVCKSTPAGDRYYNPETGSFDLVSPSPYAVLYAEFSIGSVTNYSDDTALKTVQTTDVPVSTGDPSLNDVKFKVDSNASSVDLTVFLRLEGYSTNPVYGSVVDIYNGNSGVSGILVSVDLKEGTESVELHGDPDSSIRGLLNFHVTVAAQ